MTAIGVLLILAGAAGPLSWWQWRSGNWLRAAAAIESQTSPRFLASIPAAEVGDDWYGDDPTVNRLEARCAEVMGKEAACYVPTGTLANEIALHVLCRSGHMVACEATSHVSGVEVTSAAAMNGISFRAALAPRGRLTREIVEELLTPDPYDVEVVDLLSLENTHQVGGGSVMPVDELRA